MASASSLSASSASNLSFSAFASASCYSFNSLSSLSYAYFLIINNSSSLCWALIFASAAAASLAALSASSLSISSLRRSFSSSSYAFCKRIDSIISYSLFSLSIKFYSARALATLSLYSTGAFKLLTSPFWLKSCTENSFSYITKQLLVWPRILKFSLCTYLHLIIEDHLSMGLLLLDSIWVWVFLKKSQYGN